MKGVILAGGTGSRLYPNTKVTNKHLLPVYNKPMIYYAIENLLKAGIDDILILPGKDHAGDFAKLLGSGTEFNAKFTFIIQDYAGGVAYPIKLIKNFVGDDSFVYILGDNIIGHDFYEDVQNFKGGAKIFCKQVEDPHRYGIAEVQDGKVLSLEEKPENPKSDMAVIGAYIYDNKAFEYVDNLEPSARGELEITDLNKEYLKRGELEATVIDGHYYDTGTHDSLALAAYNLMSEERPVEVYKMDTKNSPQISVGFVLHDSQVYLPDFLKSLKQQDYTNLKIYALNANNEADHDDVRYIEENYPEIEIVQPGFNTGFAKGHNMMIHKAIEDKSEFYLTINFDMIFEANFISELLNTMVKSFRNASATGKIKRWDFSKRNEYNNYGKTNFIDTCGINVTSQHRFYDRGQAEIDHGQYDKEVEVFGSSGAAVLYRLEALEDISFIDEHGRKEFFDQLMFMYKEDVDLAYRLQCAGYTAMYTPHAVGYHDRSIGGTGNSTLKIAKNRFGKSRKSKEWSWLHHHIILQKYFRNDFSLRVKTNTLWYEVKSFIFILLFEQYLLRQLKELYNMRKQIKARKAQIKKRIDMKEHIEKWMRT